MAKKSKKHENPVAEKGELESEELDQVAGGIAGTLGPDLPDTTTSDTSQSTVSNVLKSRHDTVKTSISNIR